MSNIIIGICIFALGWIANELTTVPSLVILAVCFVAIPVTLIVSGKKWKKAK